MEALSSYLLLLASFMASLAGISCQLQASCPQYVSVGGILKCTCTYKTTTPPPTLPHFSWPGFSNNDQLEKRQVSKQDNGTEFTCEMTLNNRTSTVVYTLQVAFGPPADGLTITGPQPIIANGSNPVSLTCSANDTNPVPDFTWSGVNCANGNTRSTCTFTPTEADIGKVVTCTASNIFVVPSGQTASTSFTLDVHYPPSDPPEISGYVQGQPLSTGDNLTCTVKGGNPLVDMVIFSCVEGARDVFLDNPDEVHGNSVISVLTVNSSLATSSLMHCLCNAFWNPDPSGYAQSHVVVNITVEYSSPPPPTTTTATTSTSAPPIVVITTAATETTQRPASTDVQTPSPATQQPTSVIATSQPPTQQTPSPVVTTGPESTAPTKPTSGGPTAGSGSTPTSVTGDTTTPKAGAQQDEEKYSIAILAGCLGGAFLLILLIIIIVVCRRRRVMEEEVTNENEERDVRLVNRGDSANGSYKHASEKDFYFFENVGYDRSGMQEIEPSKPPNGFPPPSSSRPNSQTNSHNLERALDFYSSVPTETQVATVRVDSEDPDEETVRYGHDIQPAVEEVSEEPVKKTSLGVGAFSSLEKQEVSLSFRDEPLPEGAFVEADTFPPPPEPFGMEGDTGDESFPPFAQPTSPGFAEQGHTQGPLGDEYAEVNRKRGSEDLRTETIVRSVNFADDTDNDMDDTPRLATSGDYTTQFP